MKTISRQKAIEAGFKWALETTNDGELYIKDILELFGLSAALDAFSMNKTKEYSALLYEICNFVFPIYKEHIERYQLIEECLENLRLYSIGKQIDIKNEFFKVHGDLFMSKTINRAAGYVGECIYMSFYDILNSSVLKVVVFTALVAYCTHHMPETETPLDWYPKTYNALYERGMCEIENIFRKYI